MRLLREARLLRTPVESQAERRGTDRRYLDKEVIFFQQQHEDAKAQRLAAQAAEVGRAFGPCRIVHLHAASLTSTAQ